MVFNSLQVALLNCQPILLGYLSDYFARLGDFNQNVTVSDNFTECSSQIQVTSTRDAYLFAMGKILICNGLSRT